MYTGIWQRLGDCFLVCKSRLVVAGMGGFCRAERDGHTLREAEAERSVTHGEKRLNLPGTLAASI